MHCSTATRNTIDTAAHVSDRLLHDVCLSGPASPALFFLLGLKLMLQLLQVQLVPPPLILLTSLSSSSLLKSHIHRKSFQLRASIAELNRMLLLAYSLAYSLTQSMPWRHACQDRVCLVSRVQTVDTCHSGYIAESVANVQEALLQLYVKDACMQAGSSPILSQQKQPRCIVGNMPDG